MCLLVLGMGTAGEVGGGGQWPCADVLFNQFVGCSLREYVCLSRAEPQAGWCKWEQCEGDVPCWQAVSSA